MLNIGKYNKLTVSEKTHKGLTLDCPGQKSVYLPAKEAPKNCATGDELTVFIYLDSRDNPVATTKKPLATVGQFANLKVISVNNVGAFLDWGLPKDLLVPFREQERPMKEERSYIVYIYYDEKSKRIAASSKIVKFINTHSADFSEKQEVDLLIANETDMGYKAVINKTHWGVLYKNEVFKQLQKGQEIKGYIKKLRPDGKIDLSLHKPGHQKATLLSDRIIDMLREQGGFIAVNDKSSPKLIYELFGESKSTFKNAIGVLYKKRLISIEKNGIKLS